MLMQVLFRKDKYKNEVIAFLPEIPVNTGMIMSYMHIGQHDEAALSYYWDTVKANKEEYNDLYDELCEIYEEKLRIKQRINYDLLRDSWR